MTLNITILTSEVIYQSADYRLFDPSTRQSLSMPSTKVVVVIQTDWTGFITYTGIGRVGAKHTSEFIRDWLEGENANSFANAVEVVRANASSWIRRVAPGSSHTFVLAGFEDGNPTAAVISNCQRWHGADLDSVSESFITSVVTANRKPEVVVTGIRNAVPRNERRDLRRFAAKYPNASVRIRRALAEATRIGSRRFPNQISEACFVYSQDRYGRGHQEAFGDSRTDPKMLMHGIDIFRAARSFLDQEFGPSKWSVKGATFGSTRDQSEPPPSCQLRLSGGDSGGGFRVIELAIPGGQSATPRAANVNGIIIGEGTPHGRGPSYPCVWTDITELEFLPLGQGRRASACDISDAGLIVGSTEMPNKVFHAHAWHLDGRTFDIGKTLAGDSIAMKVSNTGAIVGRVSLGSTESGQQHSRPAYWPVSGSPIILEGVAGASGECVDINTKGTILIRSHIGQNSKVWLRDGENTYDIGSPGPEFKSFYPHCLSESGAVVGLTIRRDGQRGAAVRNADGSWICLLTPSPKRGFTAAKGADLIAGYDEIDRYRIPWVKREKEKITYLPYFRHHHHCPTMISERKAYPVASGMINIL